MRWYEAKKGENVRILYLVIVMMMLSSLLSAGDKEPSSTAPKAKPLVTFIELGSDKCIPCKQMKPVMKEIEEMYGERVEVIYHDLWSPEKKHLGDLYRVRVIPTQVFLDKSGKEFHRHEGFYSTDQIVALLKKQGVEPIVSKGKKK